MQIEELIKKSFVQKGKRIDHRKLAEAIKLSVRTTTRFTDDEIDRCKKFLKDTENYGYLEIIKDDFRDSRLTFKNINERYESGELTLNEARNSLLPIFVMNSILTHFELEFIDFDEILVIYMEAIKEDYFDVASCKAQHFTKKIEISIIYLILEEINNFLLDKVYPLDDKEYYDNDIECSFMDLPEALEKSMEGLREKEILVLRLRFGFENESKTYDEIGTILNVTRERVRQIEAKALRKLRHPSRSRELKIYLDKNDKVYSDIYSSNSSYGKLFTKILSWDAYEESKKEQVNSDDESDELEENESSAEDSCTEKNIGDYTDSEILFIENNLGIDIELLDLNISEWPCICAMNLYKYIHAVPATDVIITFRNCKFLDSYYKLLNINAYLWEAFREEYKIRKFLRCHSAYDKLEKLIEFK